MRLLLVSIFLICTATTASAKKRLPIPAFISFGGEQIAHVVTLPNKEQLNINGEHVDVAMVYKQFSLIFIPIWNYDKRLVAVHPGNSRRFYPLERTDLEVMAGIAKKKLPTTTEVSLGFWQNIGGKVLFLSLLGLGFHRKWQNKKLTSKMDQIHHRVGMQS